MGKRLKKINWKTYNKELIKRGSITFWFSEDVENDWLFISDGGRGFQPVYSDTAIEVISLIRFHFGLTLRSVQGFTESLLKLMEIFLPVPDYSTLSRRLRKCSIDLGKIKSKEPVHAVIDSTGLKVFGEGEWKVRQHGYAKRRTWKKLHLCLDEKTGEILSTCLTDNSFKDSEVFEDLVDGLEDHVSRISADGAYDCKDCWEHCQSNDIETLIPPRKGARIREHGNNKSPPKQRDEVIRFIRKGGKKKWKKESGYSRRSIAETAMYRFKQLVGGKLSSRDFMNQANEVFIKCKILNQTTVPSSL